MYELGRPILSSHLLTQKNPQFQLCFLGRVIVCTGKQAVQPWLSACPGAEKGGHGEALLAGLRSEPLSAQSSIAGRHSAVPAPVNTHSGAQAESCTAKGGPQAEASSPASRACTRENLSLPTPGYLVPLEAHGHLGKPLTLPIFPPETLISYCHTPLLRKEEGWHALNSC